MAWLWAGYIARAAAYFGLIVVLTRELGPAGFGSLSLFLAVTLGVSQVAGSWPFLAVPVLSAHGRTIAAAFRPSVYVAAMATAACLVVALPISYAIQSRAAISLSAVVVYSVALVGLQGIFAVQQTEGRMSGIALLQTGDRLLALLLSLAAVATVSLDVLGAEVLLTVASVISCAAAFVVIGRRQELFRRPADGVPDHPVSTVMDAVGAMGIVSVCSYGVAWADIFILAIFRSNSEVGIYSLAYQVFTFVAQLGSLWAVAALPIHARSTASGQDLADQLPVPRLVAYAGLWAALIGAAAVVSVVFLPIAFGSEFSDAATPLIVLLAGSGIFAAAYFAILPGLIASGRTRLVAKVAAVSMIINIALDLILVPRIGILGPALATAAQSIFGTAALATVVLGAGSTLRLFAVGSPAVLGMVLLAIDPNSIPLTVLCGLIAAATGLWGVQMMRRAGGLPTAGHI
ncbi:MAG TPA: oligosaccharide flippase family protein [Solirubrobacterales bacterium]